MSGTFQPIPLPQPTITDPLVEILKQIENVVNHEQLHGSIKLDMVREIVKLGQQRWPAVLHYPSQRCSDCKPGRSCFLVEGEAAVNGDGDCIGCSRTAKCWIPGFEQKT